MWAMMPMFRVLLSATCLGISLLGSGLLTSGSGACRAPVWSQSPPGAWSQEPGACLPPVMRERLVRFCHPMRVFALLHRAASQVRGVEQFVREALLHRLAVAARACVADEPADAEREPAARVHLDRHLIVRATDATRL